MKKALSIFTVLLVFVSFGCQKGEQQPDPNKERIVAKNQKTALTNEMTLITLAAQRIEKEGRAMDTYRNSPNPESQRECNAVMANEQEEIQTLAQRIAKLPEDKSLILNPIIGDLNACVACTKNAAESCVKARATVNEAIKKLFPQ